MDEGTHARSPKRQGYLHLTVAAVACPCHVPIYLVIFGGTALGAFLSKNLLLFILGLTIIFLFTLAKGLKLIKVNGGSRRG